MGASTGEQGEMRVELLLDVLIAYLVKAEKETFYFNCPKGMISFYEAYFMSRKIQVDHCPYIREKESELFDVNISGITLFSEMKRVKPKGIRQVLGKLYFNIKNEAEHLKNTILRKNYVNMEQTSHIWS